ncbi:MAG: signal recognition particle-docking protein FtsY [Methylococcaceae bacterium]|nr:MAG: signal recognition particle-docking protein FtsY [Methylococcaceae bacterium]
MYRKVLLATLIAVVIGLLSAAYVGAIGAGAACPDWPGCYGRWLPLETIAGAAELPQLWAVQAHRAIQFGTVVLVIVAFGLSRAWMLGLVGAVLAVTGQMVFSALAPAYHFHPLLVVGDKLLALLALASIYRVWLATRIEESAAVVPAGMGVRWLVTLALVLLAGQVATGGWTAATWSGMACPELPTCFGSWWPDADYAKGFAVWRGLLDDQPAMLNLSERAAVNWVHRVGGVGLVLLLTVLGTLLSSGRYGKSAARNGTVINSLAFAQLLIAVLTIKYRLPVAAAVVHAGLAAGLWMHLLRASHQLARRPVQPISAFAQGGATASIGAIGLVPGTAPVPTLPAIPEKAPPTMAQRLRTGLRKTSGGLAGLLAGLTRPRIDDELLEDIETTLLVADVGVEATQDIVKALTTDYPKDTPVNSAGVRRLLRQQMQAMLVPCNHPLEIDRSHKPFVVLVVGVNGVGKTTTIGKLARRYQNDGYSVMLAAGDTFRAAAVEQLQAWGERNEITVVAQASGADSASVIFDAMQSAQAKGVDILIADTAGRLHTKSNLMEELKKIKRILGRLDETAPHEVLLVLDAGTGQNAIAQTRQFNESVGLTGIAVTKLDGTAKGGVIFALARQFGIPIRYIGVGEGIDDLQDFHAETFVDALLEQETE